MKDLVLGWKVTSGLEPQYWLSSNAKPGLQPDSQLVMVPTPMLGSHAVIVGQSGSGKSSFLGRVVEELLLRTKARCLILDPNGDFTSLHKVNSAKLWEEAVYEPSGRYGRLPHEGSQKDFLDQWSRVPIQILTAGHRQLEETNAKESPFGYKPIKLWWPSLSSEVLAEDVDPLLRSQLYHCHAFVQAIGHLVAFKSFVTIDYRGSVDPIDAAERLYGLWRGAEPAEFASGTGESFYAAMREEFSFDLDELIEAIPLQPGPLIARLGLPWFSKLPRSNSMRVAAKSRARHTIAHWFQRASTALAYVSEEVGRFYFGKVREYKAAGILTSEPQRHDLPSERVRVIDLPSLPDSITRILVTNALLSDEWNQARSAWREAREQPSSKDNRVPTFIVFDEAHNFVPAETRGSAEFALRKQFRTIAAEGRKYGLFLILASQRPDKLDPLILSECENQALMRLDSEVVLNMTCKMLGLEDIQSRLIRKCLEFGIGRALIVGRWAPQGPQLLYCAARRTVEGGRNLRAEHWAVVPSIRPRKSRRVPRA